MKEIILAILAISLLTNCNDSNKKTVDNNDRVEVPEPDKALKEEQEKQNKLSEATCSFSDPDTSVAGIKIHNVESTLQILGKQTKLEGGPAHIFYSSDKKQKLGLTVHPGSNYSEVSIFNVSYADNSKQNGGRINTKEFETEKGIKLGISKKEIIERLGNCYITKDSTKNSVELYYQLALPGDSKTKLLKSNNMPVYYAAYKLKNDKLDSFEFGFENP
ncbi:MAG: hypothetical protein WDN26_19770 [Chitinophagaceae bacterium]